MSSSLSPLDLKHHQEASAHICSPPEWWEWLSDVIQQSVPVQVNDRRWAALLNPETARQGWYLNPDQPHLFVSLVSYVIGGSSGGGYNTDTHTFINEEAEPPFTALNTILERYWPDMPLSTFQELNRNLIEREERHISEYYGNYTDLRETWIDLERVFLVLRANDRLDPMGPVAVRIFGLANPVRSVFSIHLEDKTCA